MVMILCSAGGISMEWMREPESNDEELEYYLTRVTLGYETIDICLKNCIWPNILL